MAFTLALGVQLARYLGPASYGVYGVVMGAVSLLLVPAQLGMPLLALREVPVALTNPVIDLGSVWRWHMLRPLLAGSLVFGIAAAFSGLLDGSGKIPFGTIAIAAVLGVSLTLLPVSIGLLRGLGRNVTGQMIELTVKPALTAAALAATFLAASKLSIEGALVVQLAVTCLCLAWAGIAFFRFLPRESSGHERYRPSSWIPVAAALSGNQLFAAINGNYPILVASFFVSAEGLGILRVALSSFAIVGLPTAIASIAAAPAISRALAANARSHLDDLLSFATLAGFAATLVGMVVLLVAGETLIGWVFGNEYRPAIEPLLILGVSQIVVTAFGVTGVYLAMSGRERVVLKAFAVAVPAGILTSLLLVRDFGGAGAASGTVAMAAVWHFYVFVVEREAIRAAPLSLVGAIRHFLTRTSLPHAKPS
ncbi:O-antigen/teichoic acid export membrane protein [Sphingomonas kaistensis]|uniref:O-antigen/teichoic acid export membrane protein n=1 Tax=Sphingomonas kaistensis TaxID=298708 RepID=A0A7X6BH17_9SPHN|nr:oligosaccharide flippase family protein [Sphingomonas kaistensis]NJC06473.1 O-antigen/teichoic acid export membrane protein [Sphingomonas kaistensis]